MASLQNLTDAELRRQLKELGETPGPITATTRAIYIKKLGKLKELEVGCGMFVYGIASTSMSLFIILEPGSSILADCKFWDACKEITLYLASDIVKM